jgi:hypothetical protein
MQLCASAQPSIIAEDVMTIPPETVTTEPTLNPGDEAKPGTPGAAEDICDVCSGKGKLGDGSACPECGGTGRVMRGIGGG